ncbi:hypothetical protein H4582DRAFT_2058497 [Lactarius indigo]|nr:hypothetical protein H4582DRAFT_2058497 [Lactarius indigo]
MSNTLAIQFHPRGKWTFASLNDGPRIPTAVQPIPTPAAKKVRNVGPGRGRPMQLQLTSESEAVRQLPSAGVASVTQNKVSPLSRRVPQPSSSCHCAPTYVFGPGPTFRSGDRDYNPYATTEEDSTNEDDLAALAQDPSKLQKAMASEIPSWLDLAFGARCHSSVSHTVGTGTSDNMSPGSNSYSLPMPPPVPAKTTCVKRLMLARQRPLICDIVQSAIEDLQASLIFNDAFLDGILATSFIRHSLNTAAEKVAKTKPSTSSVQKRLLDDNNYVLKIIPVLHARIPLFHSKVKDCCNSITLAEFMSKVPVPADIVQSVEWQLSGYHYVYPKGPKEPIHLGHNLIIFFTGNTGDDGELVHEVPISMVALVATAQSTEFSTTAYFDVYQNHVTTLEFIRDGRGNAFHKMMASIYAQARYPNGTARP